MLFFTPGPQPARVPPVTHRVSAAPKRCDRLARDLVECCMELLRRQPWREVASDNLLLVHVPSAETPLAVKVLGRMGPESGLEVVRGEGAFRIRARDVLGEGPSEDFTEGADILMVGFRVLGVIPDEYLRPLRAAGFRGGKDRLAPVLFARRPYMLPRGIGRSDQRMLLWLLRGLLSACAAGRLRDASLDARERSVLELRVGGELRRPTVTARRVPWPEDPDTPELPPLVALPRDLEGLPCLEQSWAVGSVYMRAELRGDGRALHGVFVLHENGVILGHHVVLGDELAPVAELLARMFRAAGTRGAGGLPRAIVFGSPRLHGAFSPALAGLGVDAALDERCPVLLDLAEGLAAVGGEVFASDSEPMGGDV